MGLDVKENIPATSHHHSGGTLNRHTPPQAHPQMPRQPLTFLRGPNIQPLLYRYYSPLKFP